MGASASQPTPDRWRRPGGLFQQAARARARTASTEQAAAAVAKAARVQSCPPPPPLAPALSAALAAVAAGTSPPTLGAWEADHATLLAAVRALTAAVTGVGPAAGGRELSPEAAAALAADDPDARAVAAAVAAGRTLAADAALASLCARLDLTPAHLAARATELGWDASFIPTRAAALRALLAATDTAAAGEGGWDRVVDHGPAGLTIDYRTLRPPVPPAGESAAAASSSSSSASRPLTLHCLVMADVFPGPPATVLALTREVDLVRKWNPFCTVGTVLEARPHPGWARVGYAAMRVLRGFPVFDICVRGVGHDCSVERGLAVVTLGQAAPDEVPPPPGAPPIHHAGEPPGAAACHRVTLHPGSGLLYLPLPPDPDRPGAPPRTLGTLAVVMDLRLSLVPAFLVKWVITYLLPFLARDMKRHIAGPWFQASGGDWGGGNGSGRGGGGAPAAAPTATTFRARLSPRPPAPPAAAREAGLFADRMASSFTYREFEDGVAAAVAGGRLWAEGEDGGDWLARVRRTGRV